MSGEFFNEENVVWDTITRVANMIVLNIVFVLCCLPIVTIGASFTALYTVTFKMVKDKDSYVVRAFFQAFKTNFKKSTIIWLIMLVVGVLIAGDWYLAREAALSFMGILNGVFLLLVILYLMILSYVFPLQSKFENKISATFVNAALMGIGYLFPWTIFILLLNTAPILLMLLSANVYIVLIPVMLLCGFAVIAYVNSKMFEKLFEKHAS